MAVVRPELELAEAREIVYLLREVKRGTPLWRARRELTRSLERAEDAEARQKEEMERIRAKRRVPEEGTLIPQSMSSQRERLVQKRAQLKTPAERIAFDNDPANGPVALRVAAMLAEPKGGRS